MANNFHFEARRRQGVLDRACKIQKDRALAQNSDGGAPVEDGPKPETIMCTDQGQFYQTRENEEQEKKEGAFTYGLVQKETAERTIAVERDQFLEALGVILKGK